jgi:hypothetical protein
MIRVQVDAPELVSTAPSPRLPGQAGQSPDRTVEVQRWALGPRGV